MTSLSHSLPLRVYYEDTDHGGIVYHANYLKFMERGRTEFLRAGGVELDALERDSGALFTVTAADVRFLEPARFNDELEVVSVVREMRGARLIFDQTVYLTAEGVEERLLVSAEIHVACTGRNGRARRIPETVLAAVRPSLPKESPNP